MHGTWLLLGAFGVSVGLAVPSLLIAIQEAAPSGHLATVTALNHFFRQRAFGVALFGALVGDGATDLHPALLVNASLLGAALLLAWYLPK